MKTVLLVIFLVSSNAFGDVEADKKELQAIGQRIIKTNQAGATDWSCVGSSGRDFCKVGAVHYNKAKDEVKVSGQEFKAYIESLKKNEAAEKACLDPVFNQGKFKSSNWKDFNVAIGCLGKIQYQVAKPDGIDFFYFKPTEIFSANNLATAIDMLTTKRNELNPKLKDEVEDEPVSSEQFAKAQQKQKGDEAKRAIKIPPIPSAGSLRAGGEKKKRFRFMFTGDGIIGFGCKKGTGKCTFKYVSSGDTGFGAKQGEGTYAVECYSAKSCSPLENAAGVDSSSPEAIVEFLEVGEFTGGNGQVLRLPVLKVIEIQ